MAPEIINRSKRRIVAEKCTVCRSVISKVRGLMFSGKRCLIFEFKREHDVSLHMLFVFFPIWVVYLDKNKKAVYIKKLFPFISFCSHRAKYILELVKKPNIEIGDRIFWKQ